MLKHRQQFLQNINKFLPDYKHPFVLTLRFGTFYQHNMYCTMATGWLQADLRSMACLIRTASFVIAADMRVLNPYPANVENTVSFL